MNAAKVPLLDVILALAVTGAGMSPWPWLALIVAGAYFAVLACIIDRRTPPDEGQK